ncbi:uncharacterized protein [Haliotis asinina]|uniref:uncharacterized protein n=1 Tax=Haliotis asinina TaxID=109174 RepID=UPI0035323F3A
MDAQMQNGNCAVPGNHIMTQSWSGVNPAGADPNHKTQEAVSVGHGQEVTQEWISCFDDFYSDVFLHDFQNVDMAKYNVVCTLGMRGDSTTSVCSSATIPPIYSNWNNQTSCTTNFTKDNAGCVAAAEAYLQWSLGQTMIGEHLPDNTSGYSQGYLQTPDMEHERGYLPSVGREHPQGHLQPGSGECQQGHLQTVGGEHPQGHLQPASGEYQQGHLQPPSGEYQQGHLQTVGGEHPQGYLQPSSGECQQGHLQTVGGEHPQGCFKTVDGEHPHGYVQTVDGEHPQGYLQTVGREHLQGYLQTSNEEQKQGYLQTTSREHQQGHMQPLDGEHSQEKLQTAQQLVIGAPQEPQEEACVFTHVRKRNLGTQNLQKEDLTFLPTCLPTSSNCGPKACTGNPDVGPTLPSISIIFNNINGTGESTEACKVHSAESDGSVGHVTSSEDTWQTTSSTYGSLNSVKSSPILGPTSSDHVSSSSDSRDSSKRVRVREVRRAVDEPRRPKNGFIRFSIEHRQQIAVKHPRLDNREISRMLGCKWRKLSNEEKKPYEEEFEKDIQAIREVNPEWRYAPARQLVEELIEPMPSRLRPRNSLKRKKLPSLVRTYSRRQNKSSKNSKKPSPTVHREMLDPPATLLRQEDTSTTWVQCDLCGKWRCLPSFIPPKKLCDIWFCYFNPDKRYNSCSIKEDLDPEDSANPPHLPVPPNSSCTEYSDSGAHVVSRESTW